MGWDEVLGAAPDAAFFSELQRFLMSVKLSRDLPDFLENTYVRGWEEAGLARQDQIAGLWINLGMAAVTLRSAHADAAEFAFECTERGARFTNAIPDAEARRRFVRAQALLILATSEEDTSPDICRSLLKENTGLVEFLAQQLARFSTKQVQQHVPAALAITLNALTGALFHQRPYRIHLRAPALCRRRTRSRFPFASIRAVMPDGVAS